MPKKAKNEYPVDGRKVRRDFLAFCLGLGFGGLGFRVSVEGLGFRGFGFGVWA